MVTPRRAARCWSQSEAVDLGARAGETDAGGVFLHGRPRRGRQLTTQRREVDGEKVKAPSGGAVRF